MPGREPSPLRWPPRAVLHQAHHHLNSKAWNATTGFMTSAVTFHPQALPQGSGCLSQHTPIAQTPSPFPGCWTTGPLQLHPPLGPQQTLAIAAAAVTLCKASAQFAALTSALIGGAASNTPPSPLIWVASFLGWAGVWTG